MTIVLKVISYLALAMTVIPAFLVFAGTMTWDTHANLMMAGTIIWFITAPFWIRDKK